MALYASELQALQPRPYAARLKKSSAEDEIESTLIDRFYVDQKATVIGNGYSTEFMYFPSDLDPRRRDYLYRKIHDVMEYATAFKDVEELNALRQIPQSPPASNYLPLGLYLYLADECSRLEKDKTFLEAMRGAKKKLHQGVTEDSSALLLRAHEALRILGMERSHGKILEEWATTGGYTIQGERNGEDAQKKLVGSYACLARDICMEQDYLGMNLPVSFALGNAEKMLELKTAESAHTFIKSLTQGPYKKPIDPYIRQCIDRGYERRVTRIDDIIRSKMQHEWDAKKFSIRTAESENKVLAKQVFALVPEAARKILFYEGYNCAYARHKNISSIYPDAPINGTSAEDHEGYRISNGLRQKRYRTIFLSNAGIENIEGPDGQQLIVQRLAQILTHEVTHMAISHLNKKEKKCLWDLVENLHVEIQAGNLPAYFDKKDITGTLDYSSQYYVDHYNKDERKEEMVCNLAGLLPQFPYPPPSPDNNMAPRDNPYADLQSLGPLAAKLTELLDVAARRCQKTFANVKLSPPSPYLQ